MATIRQLPNSKFRTEVRKQQILIQTKTFSSLALAEKWGKKIDSQVQVILNLTPKQIKKLSPDKVEELGGLKIFHKLKLDVNFVLFNDLTEEYTSQWTGKDQNQIHRARYWKKIFDDTPIKSIKTKHVRKAINVFSKEKITNGAGQITDKLRSSNTVIRYKAVLSAMFKYAISQGYLKNNPVTDVYIKPTPNKVNRYLSDDERKRLLVSSRESSWNKLYLLVVLAISTGMRKSELMGLRWKDINIERAEASLGDSKNGDPRINPIPEFAMAELVKFKQEGNGLIFNSPTKPEKPFEFTKRWKCALNLAGIYDFKFHWLRHSAASYFVMGGATLYETAQLLGHRSTQTTTRYAHLSTAHKASVSERIMGEVFNEIK